MKNSSLKTKPISLFVVVVFFAANCVLAYAPEVNFWKQRGHLALPSPLKSQPQLSFVKPRQHKPIPQNSLLKSVAQSLPQKYGNIRDVSGPLDGKNIVVHIQDVHMNTEAQKNIGLTIQHLINQGKLDLLGLEAAFGAMNFSRFRQPEVQIVVRKVADYLLEQDKMSGPLHAVLANQRHIPALVGVDDFESYHANVKAYQKSAKLAQAAKLHLANQKKELVQKKRIVFNAALMDFDQRVQSYVNGATTVGPYVRMLSQYQADLPVNMEMFLHAWQMELTMSIKNVERERAHLLSSLVEVLDSRDIQNLTNQSLSFRQGKVRHKDFYGYLKNLCDQKGVKFNRFPVFRDYVQYVLLSDAIDSSLLFKEIRKTEKETYRSLTKSQEEERLIQESRKAQLVAKLVNFSLTPDEWKEYQTVGAGLRARPNAQSSAGLGGHGGPPLRSFEEFYIQAEKRDKAMAANLMKAMKKERANVVVLVTGGFHSKGIEEHLANFENKPTLISFVPKISKVETQKGSAYLSVFTQEKSPLHRIFKGQPLFLAAEQLDPIPDLLAGVAGVTRNPEIYRRLLPAKARINLRIKALNEKASIVESKTDRGQARVKVMWSGDVGPNLKIESIANETPGGAGGVIDVLKNPILWITGLRSKTYDLFAAFFVENLFLRLLMVAVAGSFVFDPMTNRIVWVVFAFLHLPNFFLRVRGGRDAPAWVSVLSAVFLAVFNIYFGLSPLDPLSLSTHFLLNLLMPVLVSRFGSREQVFETSSKYPWFNQLDSDQKEIQKRLDQFIEQAHKLEKDYKYAVDKALRFDETGLSTNALKDVEARYQVLMDFVQSYQRPFSGKSYFPNALKEYANTLRINHKQIRTTFQALKRFLKKETTKNLPKDVLSQVAQEYQNYDKAKEELREIETKIEELTTQLNKTTEDSDQRSRLFHYLQNYQNKIFDKQAEIGNHQEALVSALTLRVKDLQSNIQRMEVVLYKQVQPLLIEESENVPAVMEELLFEKVADQEAQIDESWRSVLVREFQEIIRQEGLESTSISDVRMYKFLNESGVGPGLLRKFIGPELIKVRTWQRLRKATLGAFASLLIFLALLVPILPEKKTNSPAPPLVPPVQTKVEKQQPPPVRPVKPKDTLKNVIDRVNKKTADLKKSIKTDVDDAVQKEKEKKIEKIEKEVERETEKTNQILEKIADLDNKLKKEISQSQAKEEKPAVYVDTSPSLLRSVLIFWAVFIGFHLLIFSFRKGIHKKIFPSKPKFRSGLIWVLSLSLSLGVAYLDRTLNWDISSLFQTTSDNSRTESSIGSVGDVEDIGKLDKSVKIHGYDNGLLSEGGLQNLTAGGKFYADQTDWRNWPIDKSLAANDWVEMEMDSGSLLPVLPAGRVISYVEPKEKSKKGLKAVVQYRSYHRFKIEFFDMTGRKVNVNGPILVYHRPIRSGENLGKVNSKIHGKIPFPAWLEKEMEGLNKKEASLIERWNLIERVLGKVTYDLEYKENKNRPWSLDILEQLKCICNGSTGLVVAMAERMNIPGVMAVQGFSTDSRWGHIWVTRINPLTNEREVYETTAYLKESSSPLPRPNSGNQARQEFLERERLRAEKARLEKEKRAAEERKITLLKNRFKVEEDARKVQAKKLRQARIQLYKKIRQSYYEEFLSYRKSLKGKLKIQLMSELNQPIDLPKLILVKKWFDARGKLTNVFFSEQSLDQFRAFVHYAMLRLNAIAWENPELGRRVREKQAELVKKVEEQLKPSRQDEEPIPNLITQKGLAEPFSLDEIEIYSVPGGESLINLLSGETIFTPQGHKLVDYHQGVYVFYSKKEGYYLKGEKAKGAAGQYFKSFKLIKGTLRGNRWLGIGQDEQGYRYIGSEATRLKLDSRKLNQAPEIVVLDSGRWLGAEFDDTERSVRYEGTTKVHLGDETSKAYFLSKTHPLSKFYKKDIYEIYKTHFHSMVGESINGHVVVVVPYRNGMGVDGDVKAEEKNKRFGFASHPFVNKQGEYVLRVTSTIQQQMVATYKGKEVIYTVVDWQFWGPLAGRYNAKSFHFIGPIHGSKKTGAWVAKTAIYTARGQERRFVENLKPSFEDGVLRFSGPLVKLPLGTWKWNMDFESGLFDDHSIKINDSSFIAVIPYDPVPITAKPNKYKVQDSVNTSGYLAEYSAGIIMPVDRDHIVLLDRFNKLVLKENGPEGRVGLSIFHSILASYSINDSASLLRDPANKFVAIATQPRQFMSDGVIVFVGKIDSQTKTFIFPNRKFLERISTKYGFSYARESQYPFHQWNKVSDVVDISPKRGAIMEIGIALRNMKEARKNFRQAHIDLDHIFDVVMKAKEAQGEISADSLGYLIKLLKNSEHEHLIVDILSKVKEKRLMVVLSETDFSIKEWEDIIHSFIEHHLKNHPTLPRPLVSLGFDKKQKTSVDQLNQFLLKMSDQNKSLSDIIKTLTQVVPEIEKNDYVFNLNLDRKRMAVTPDQINELYEEHISNPLQALNEETQKKFDSMNKQLRSNLFSYLKQKHGIIPEANFFLDPQSYSEKDRKKIIQLNDLVRSSLPSEKQKYCEESHQAYLAFERAGINSSNPSLSFDGPEVRRVVESLRSQPFDFEYKDTNNPLNVLIDELEQAPSWRKIGLSSEEKKEREERFERQTRLKEIVGDRYKPTLLKSKKEIWRQLLNAVFTDYFGWFYFFVGISLFLVYLIYDPLRKRDRKYIVRWNALDRLWKISPWFKGPAANEIKTILANKNGGTLLQSERAKLESALSRLENEKAYMLVELAMAVAPFPRGSWRSWFLTLLVRSLGILGPPVLFNLVFGINTPLQFFILVTLELAGFFLLFIYPGSTKERHRNQWNRILLKHARNLINTTDMDSFRKQVEFSLEKLNEKSTFSDQLITEDPFDDFKDRVMKLYRETLVRPNGSLSWVSPASQQSTRSSKGQNSNDISHWRPLNVGETADMYKPDPKDPDGWVVREREKENPKSIMFFIDLSNPLTSRQKDQLVTDLANALALLTQSNGKLGNLSHVVFRLPGTSEDPSRNLYTASKIVSPTTWSSVESVNRVLDEVLSSVRTQYDMAQQRLVGQKQSIRTLPFFSQEENEAYQSWAGRLFIEGAHKDRMNPPVLPVKSLKRASVIPLGFIPSEQTPLIKNWLKVGLNPWFVERNNGNGPVIKRGRIAGALGIWVDVAQGGRWEGRLINLIGIGVLLFDRSIGGLGVYIGIFLVLSILSHRFFGVKKSNQEAIVYDWASVSGATLTASSSLLALPLLLLGLSFLSVSQVFGLADVMGLVLLITGVYLGGFIHEKENIRIEANRMAKILKEAEFSLGLDGMPLSTPQSGEPVPNSKKELIEAILNREDKLKPQPILMQRIKAARRPKNQV